MSERRDRVGGASFRIVGREVVFRGWATLAVARVERQGADGERERIDRLIEDHGTAAAVLPFDPVRRVAVLVRQFRAPVADTDESGVLTEAIAGLVDPGETPEVAARREAHEEAGLALAVLEEVGTFRSMPGISTERITLFLAETDLAEDRTGQGGGAEGESEDVEVVVLPLAELARMADTGALVDLKTFALLQALRLRRGELFED